jgi:3-methyladenine DNA glycosylase AlkD
MASVPSRARHSAEDVMTALAEASDVDDAVFLQGYFKTGPGEYGEGDVFIGVRVPAVRTIVKRLAPLSLESIAELLDSEVHEHRLAGLIALNTLFAAASTVRARDEGERERLTAFYLGAVRAGRINNWDLVDASAEFVLGEYLVDKPRFILFELIESPDLWWRRVALLSSFAFIKGGDAATTIELASRLLDDGDRRDLTQKAAGWMLREVGKRVDRQLLLDFLDTNAQRMPAVMLSYATEHLDADARAAYRARRGCAAPKRTP